MSIIDDFKDINRRMNRKQEKPPVSCVPDWNLQLPSIEEMAAIAGAIREHFAEVSFCVPYSAPDSDPA